MVVHKIGVAEVGALSDSIWFDAASDYNDPSLYSFPANTNAQDIDTKYTMNWEFSSAASKGDFNFMTWKGFNTRSLILSGIFKTRIEVDDFMKIISRVRLKKIYLENDRFYVGIQNEPKVQRVGSRGPNIRDWLVEFFCFDPFIYSDTLKSKTVNGLGAGPTSIPDIVNNGSIYAYPALHIEHASGNVTSITIRSDHEEGSSTPYTVTLSGGSSLDGSAGRSELFVVPYFFRNELSKGTAYLEVPSTINSDNSKSTNLQFIGGQGRYLRIGASGSDWNVTVAVVGGTVNITFYWRDTFL